MEEAYGLDVKPRSPLDNVKLVVMGSSKETMTHQADPLYIKHEVRNLKLYDHTCA